MPTRLYYAPAAAGKTAYAVQLARKTAASLTADVRVCVPTSLQAHAFRERLAKAGGAIGVQVSTFDELVSDCLDAAGETYVGLSEPVQYRLLRAIVDRLPLDHFALLKNKPGFIQLLQQMITEFKFAQIEPIHFLEAAELLGNEPRLTELGTIYDSYQTQLQAQEWADRVGMYWLAAESIRDRAPDVGRNWSLFIIDGFDDFTPIQLELIRLISGRAAETVVTLTHSETADYPRFDRTRKAIEDALGRDAKPLPDSNGQNGRNPALVNLGRALFVQTTEPIANGQTVVELIQASDRTTEARAALRWLKARIVDDHMRPNELALLARDTSQYRPFISQIAAEFGLSIRFVDGLPLAQGPLIAALLNLLRLNLPAAPDNKPELARRAVVSAWRSPYFLLDFLEPGDPDILDNIGRHQRVIRGLDQWQAAFEAQTNAAAGQQDRESDEEQPIPRLPTGSAAQALQQKFNRFLTLIQPDPTAPTMRAFVGWLETLIGPDPEPDRRRYHPSENSLQITFQARQNNETKTADIAALQALKDILRGFVWAEAALGINKPVDYVYFFNELSGAINSAYYHLPAHKERAEMLVADAAQVRGLPFRAVAILGLSEGEFPAVIGEDPFLRDADRAALQTECNFKLEPSTRSAEREFFYEAIARPADKLLLTRPTLADNGADWPPSPFWEAVCQLINAPTAPTLSGESFIDLDSAASWAEYWQSLAQLSFSVERVYETETWAQINRTAEILQSREQSAANQYDGFLPQLTSQLTADFSPEHTWSASRLETYQRCGYFFYIQNVLNLHPRPEPTEGLDATQLGSVYHRIFEAVYNADLPDTLNAETSQDAVTAAASPILDEAPQKEGFRETPWWSQTRQEIIENVAASVLALETDNFRFFQSEAAFGFDELPELVIETPVGPLRLRGFIDRIDRDERGNLRIVDYKLGGPGQFTKRAFDEGKKLQLPLYALAAQQTLGLGAVVEGFYWHFRSAEKSWFSLSKADGGSEGAIETAVTHAAHAVDQIRNGRFTPKAPAGGCPAYCPAAAFCWHYSPPSY